MTPSSLGRGELGATLRAWRNRISPADVGLNDAGPRRTPGLRRSELARIAGVSPDYLTQLEQGRAAAPSAQVLSALARALRISAAEIGQLFRLAGLPEPGRRRVLRQLPEDVSRMIDGLNHAPVSVYDARWDPIAWNPLWAAVMGDPAGRPLPERNLARRQFLGLPTRVVRDCDATEEFEHALVADLRGTAVRYPRDPTLAALIAELGRSSERFRTWWDSRPAGVYEAEVKTVDHPEAGAFTVACTVLTTRRDDLRVVIYTPGGPAASRAVRRLRDDCDDALILNLTCGQRETHANTESAF
jgi:transcriptional regulator with XRE-family HTH domain